MPPFRFDPSPTSGDSSRIAELEDALKDRERRIEDLKGERDAQAETIKSLREQIEECDAQIERWIEAFDMVLHDDGTWHWREGLIQDRDKRFNEYVELRAKGNRFVPRYNGTAAPRNMGRPPQASEAQQQRVLVKRAAGQSLRSIAEEMELGLQTVRTTIDRKDGIDRATVARLQRISPDKIAEARTRRSSKEIAALPKRINANLKRNAELIKAAKGLG